MSRSKYLNRALWFLGVIKCNGVSERHYYEEMRKRENTPLPRPEKMAEGLLPDQVRDRLSRGDEKVLP